MKELLLGMILQRLLWKSVNIDCKVIPIETKDYPTQAIRPLYSVLDKSKITSDFKVTIPHWRDSLDQLYKKNKSQLMRNIFSYRRRRIYRVSFS